MSDPAVVSLSLPFIFCRTYFDNIVAIDSLLEHIMVSVFGIRVVAVCQTVMSFLTGRAADSNTVLTLLCVLNCLLNGSECPSHFSDWLYSMV